MSDPYSIPRGAGSSFLKFLSNDADRDPVSTIDDQPEASAYQGVGSASGRITTSHSLGAVMRDGWVGTPALLEVFDARSDVVIASFDRILLLSSSESEPERVDPSYTFGTSIVFSGGRQPRIYVFQGAVIVSERDGDTKNALVRFYNTYLKATACLDGVERKDNPWAVRLSFRGLVREGYILSFDTSTTSDAPSLVSVAFSMFVVSEY